MASMLASPARFAECLQVVRDAGLVAADRKAGIRRAIEVFLEGVPASGADASGLVSSLERAASKIMGRRMTTREVSEARDEEGVDLAKRLANLNKARGWQVYPDPALEADVLLFLGKSLPKDKFAAPGTEHFDIASTDGDEEMKMGVGTRDRWADVVDTSSEGRDDEAEVDDDGCVAGFDVVASMRECAVAQQLASSFTTLKRAHGRREFAWLPKPLLAGPLVATVADAAAGAGVGLVEMAEIKPRALESAVVNTVSVGTAWTDSTEKRSIATKSFESPKKSDTIGKGIRYKMRVGDQMDNYKVADADSKEATEEVSSESDEERLDPAAESFFNALFDLSVEKSLDKSGLKRQYSAFVKSRTEDGYSQAEAVLEAKDLITTFSEAIKGTNGDA